MVMINNISFDNLLGASAEKCQPLVCLTSAHDSSFLFLEVCQLSVTSLVTLTIPTPPIVWAVHNVHDNTTGVSYREHRSWARRSFTDQTHHQTCNWLYILKIYLNINTSIASVFCDRNGEISAAQKEASVIYNSESHGAYCNVVTVSSAEHIVWCISSPLLHKSCTEERYL